MSKSFLQRRHEKETKYDIQAQITGISLPDGKIHWNIEIDGEDDKEIAAGILEKAAEVLRVEKRQILPAPCKSNIRLWKIKQAIKRVKSILYKEI